MATECIAQLTFKCYPKTTTVARFDQAQASTDGGVVLLKALDDRLQLTDRLAACLPDRRDPDKVRHAVRDLLRQRIFGLACGYEDGNDAAATRGWSGAPGACWAKPTACRNIAATRSMSMGRPSMRPTTGRIAAA